MNSMIVVPFIVTSILLLIIRLVIAVAFFFSALNKAKSLKKSAKQNGLPAPIMGIVMVAEFAGALGMATGILATWAALGAMLLLAGTLSLHVFVWRSKYWASKGGSEYDLMLFCLAAVIALFGPGLLVIPLAFLGIA